MNLWKATFLFVPFCVYTFSFRVTHHEIMTLDQQQRVTNLQSRWHEIFLWPWKHLAQWWKREKPEEKFCLRQRRTDRRMKQFCRSCEAKLNEKICTTLLFVWYLALTFLLQLVAQQSGFLVVFCTIFCATHFKWEISLVHSFSMKPHSSTCWMWLSIILLK